MDAALRVLSIVVLVLSAASGVSSVALFGVMLRKDFAAAELRGRQARAGRFDEVAKASE